MGCWNSSCALTNLPIREGDAIVVIPLYGSAMGHLGVGYAPIGLPIIGEYNDYGMIEGITNPNVADVFYKHIMSVVKDNKCTIQKDKNHCKDGIPKDADQLLLCIERGLVMDVSRENSSHTVSEFNFLMMHKSAYDAVIKDVGGRVPYDADHTMRESYEYTLEDVITKYKNNPHTSRTLFEILTENTEKEKNPDITETELAKIIDEALEGYDFDVAYDAKENYNDIIRWFECSHFNNRFILDYYMDNYTDELCDSIIDFVMIKYAFDVGRINWVPTCGRGSQAEEYRIPLILTEVINKLADDRQYDHDGVNCDNCIHSVHVGDGEANDCVMDRTNLDGQCCSFDDEDAWGRESANDPKRWL